MNVKVLGIRFCSVTDQAESMIAFLQALGLPQLTMPEVEGCIGGIFPAGESWVEIWQEGPQMPAGIMLQIVVDDADAWADQARANGLQPQGPTDAHGERIYFLQAPGGLSMSFQSRLQEAD
ncbi:MAG: hypothetical protein Tsb002_31080 [Wenzhouxiangellaceae bacterium]